MRWHLPRHACALLLCGLAVLAFRPSPSEIAVGPGENLQDAIDRASPGDTITLARGATYVGNFVLPAKGGSDYITIRTAGDEGLPPAGQRITPAAADALAKLKSPNSQAVLRTAPSAHHWRLELLELQANRGGFSDILLLGDGTSAQVDPAIVPHDLIVERCYIHGDPTVGQKRAIALNSASTSIVDSYISDIKAVGQDSQAIAGWNGPGPFRIENNYLEAAGENFLLGGASQLIPNLVPSDVRFLRNEVAKPPEWRKSKWQVKNLFELKNARRVLVQGNLFQYNWQAAQAGYAIVLTPRNDGAAPWATVEDVTFRGNVVRHVAAVFNILGTDDTHESGPARRIQITNNVFYAVDDKTWGGNGAFMQMGVGPSDVTVSHNTILQSGILVGAYGGTKEKPSTIIGFVFTDNIAKTNTYGVFGAGRSPGNDTLTTFFPGAVFAHNALAGASPSRYPGANLFPSVQQMEQQFIDASTGDFRLVPDSSFRGVASDGTNLGASFERIRRLVGDRALREIRDHLRIPPNPGGGGCCP
jgi:hypothetical protein